MYIKCKTIRHSKIYFKCTDSSIRNVEYNVYRSVEKRNLPPSFLIKIEIDLF